MKVPDLIGPVYDYSALSERDRFTSKTPPAKFSLISNRKLYESHLSGMILVGEAASSNVNTIDILCEDQPALTACTAEGKQ